MIHAILGKKFGQTQTFLTDGTRIPVTQITVPDNIVFAVKTKDKHAYSALQLGLGMKKKANRSLIGHAKKANAQTAPLFIREVRFFTDVQENALPKIGESVKVEDVLKPGDIIQVTGISKGKGFAGGVKRHHFKGGPRTHGQSDRERAPGSIGQTTTPGRVYRGKRMAGRMGHETATVRNLSVVDIISNDDEKVLLIKGLVPGVRNGVLYIEKVGEMKKFVPLYKGEEEKPKEEKQAASATKIETVSEEPKQEKKAEKIETSKDGKENEK